MGFANAQVADTRSLDHDQPWDPGPCPGKIYQQRTSSDTRGRHTEWLPGVDLKLSQISASSFASCWPSLLSAQLESFSASDGIEGVQRDWEDNSLKFCNFVLRSVQHQV